MKSTSDKLLVTTSRSLLCVDAKTGHMTKLHTGKGLYYGITSDKDFIYVGARNRLVSSDTKPTNEAGVILKFDHNLQLIGELRASFPLRDIHQIKMIDHKLYVTCTHDNMVAVYDGENWEQWYPDKHRHEDKNHFNSLYNDKNHIYLLAHNWGDSEVYVFDLNSRKLIKKTKMGKCAHNIWLDKHNTMYTLSSEESKLVDSQKNTTLMLEGFPRGIVTTDKYTYIGISERAERNIRDFVDGKILIFDKQQNKIGELSLESVGMVLDIKVINQQDHISNEYTHVNKNIIDNIHTMDYDYRGSREFIKNRLEMYLPFLMPLKEIYPKGAVIDVECGRGVWLELLKENGIDAQGITLEEEMLCTCQNLGLNATRGDAIKTLREQADKSLIAVSAFHIVGNTPLNELQQFVTESLRTLKPGGLLIMETPNLEHVKDTPKYFYMDASHTRSIPSALLSFVAEHHTDEHTKIIRLQEPKELSDQLFVTMQHTIEGISSDCAIIIQKKAKPTMVNITNNSSFTEYSSSPLEVSKKFEAWAQNIQADIDKVNFKASEAQQAYHDLRMETHNKITKVIVEMKKSNEKLEKANEAYNRIRNSTSWKITKPLRIASDTVKQFIRDGRNRLKSTPKS